MALCGFGMFQSPNNRGIFGSAPLSRTGGLDGGSRQALSLASGLAALGVIVSLLRVRPAAPPAH